MKAILFPTFLYFLSCCDCLHLDAVLQYEVDELRKQVEGYVLELMKDDFGWNDQETHRAVIALALGNNSFFQGRDIYSCVIVKQLKLELSGAIIEWQRKPLSVGQLTLFINALIATCTDPHDFYSINLVSQLRSSEPVSDYENALKILTLCIAGDKISKSVVLEIRELLKEPYRNIQLDDQAIALIAISCATDHFQSTYIRPIVNELLQSLKSKQMEDGSFGNIYTTALVVQALITAGDNDDILWFRRAFEYFKDQYSNLDGKFNLLTHFFILPTLNLKSLAHLNTICDFAESKHGTLDSQINMILTNNYDEDDEYGMNIVSNSSGDENSLIAVIYSLWTEGQGGDDFNISTVVYINEGETLFDVMKKATLTDKNFNFHVRHFSFGAFIESLAGIENNKHNKFYWFIYKIEDYGRKLQRAQKDVSSIKPKDGDHYLLWYRKP